MFADKKDKNMTEPTTGQNRINEGTILRGDIKSQGFFRIDGTIEGNVSTPSKVVLGKTGRLNGTLICENADIEGNFEGDLNVTGLLTLRATAEIEGKVIAGKLSVEPGAIFNATCAMKGATSEKTNVVSATPDAERLKKQNHPFDRSQRIQKSKTEPST